MSLLKEFKAFAVRGNVLDMAIGVIIGGAFSKIVNSLVKDVIMPLLGTITGKINISALEVKIPVNSATGEPILIKYGLFLQNIIDFLIIVFCIFIFVKLINNFRKKEEKAPPKPTAQEVLLTEIRDLLKNR